LKEKGISTLGGVKIYWDDNTGRLNGEGRGIFIGEFDGDDKVLVIYNDGSYELTNYELINRYEPETVYLIQKFWSEMVVNCIYFDGKTKNYFVKRFQIETTTIGKKFVFIGEAKGTTLAVACTNEESTVLFTTEDKKKVKGDWILEFPEFMEVQGWKTVGSRLSTDVVKKVLLQGEKVGHPPVPPSQTVAEQFAEENKNTDQLNLL